tara:strand:- start:442 stop:966 length:525 start_codon:yes stop_codon:yes gene_type:complete
MGINFPEGTQNVPTNLVQTVWNFQNSRWAFNSGSWTDVSGISCTITPKFSSSRILVQISMGACGTDQNNFDHGQAMRIMRNNGSSDIRGVGDGSRERVAMQGSGWCHNGDHNAGGVGMIGVDYPNSTSGVTYKLQARCQSRQFVMNGCPNNSNTGNVYHVRSCSSIILTEFQTS